MTDDLDRRLTALARAPLTSPVTLDVLALAARQAARTSRGRRLGIVGLSALLAVGVGVTAAPAAADIVQKFLAQSDWHPHAGGEILADSEWVNVDAPDLVAYVDSIYPDYLVLAPGQTREQVVSDAAGVWANMSGLAQEVSFRRDMEMAVFCGWAQEFVAADAAGDSGRVDDAVEAMRLTATWPAQADTDGGGVVDRQYEIIDAGIAGDWADFTFGVEQDGCGNYPTSVPR